MLFNSDNIEQAILAFIFASARAGPFAHKGQTFRNRSWRSNFKTNEKPLYHDGLLSCRRRMSKMPSIDFAAEFARAIFQSDASFSWFILRQRGR